MTRFFDSFGITRGDFNMKGWQNKVGTVHCDWQYDPTEDDKKSKKFKQLIPIVPKKSSAGNTVETVVNVLGGTVVSTPAEDTSNIDIF